MRKIVVLAIPICLILGSSGLLFNSYLETDHFLKQEDDLVRGASRLPKDTSMAGEEGVSEEGQISLYERIYQRGLFGRPVSEAPELPSARPEDSAGPEEEEIAQLRLTGTAQVGADYLAAIEDGSTGQTKFMRPGEEIAGYTIVEISPETAKLENQEGEIITLSIERE